MSFRIQQKTALRFYRAAFRTGGILVMLPRDIFDPKDLPLGAYNNTFPDVDIFNAAGPTKVEYKLSCALDKLTLKTVVMWNVQVKIDFRRLDPGMPSEERIEQRRVFRGRFSKNEEEVRDIVRRSLCRDEHSRDVGSMERMDASIWADYNEWFEGRADKHKWLKIPSVWRSVGDVWVYEYSKLRPALFLLANECIGLEPQKMAVGDMVCVPMGAKVPLIVRRLEGKEGGYTFVGECYLDGFMDGRVWDHFTTNDVEAIALQ